MIIFIVFAAVRFPAFSSMCLCSCLACRTWCFSQRTARPSTPATPHRTTQRTACSCCRRRDEQHTEWTDRQTDRPTHTHTHTTQCCYMSYLAGYTFSCAPHVSGHVWLHSKPTVQNFSTGNLLNANHTEENLGIINPIRDACEPSLTAAYFCGADQSFPGH